MPIISCRVSYIELGDTLGSLPMIASRFTPETKLRTGFYLMTDGYQRDASPKLKIHDVLLKSKSKKLEKLNCERDN